MTARQEQHLLERAAQGDDVAFAELADRARPLVRAELRGLFITDGDHDDLRQVALLALWSACRSYRPQRGPFLPFARMVVRRHVQTRVSAANRAKHRILSDATRPDVVEPRAVNPDPLRTVIAAEDLQLIARRLHEDCTSLEATAIRGLLEGRCMRELAEAAGVDIKAIDNARTRARSKLRVDLVA
jgi:RNA polymerase sigma factor (sigma-70 family)